MAAFGTTVVATAALAAALAAAGPAFAGGGAGMTLTAGMSGQNGVLPVGSLHTVWTQVTDSALGEATLEYVTVTVSGAAAPVVCDRGPNGTVVLVPGRTVECSTSIAAGAGAQSVTVQASGVVAGGGSKLVRTVVVSYRGSVPRPVPAPTSSSPRGAAVRSPSTLLTPMPSPVPGRRVLPSAALSAGCVGAMSATSVVNGSGCVPSASPSADCAAPPGGGPAAPGSESCATANGWGALALTGSQVMGWGAVAVVAVVSGVVLMVRHRRTVK